MPMPENGHQLLSLEMVRYFHHLIVVIIGVKEAAFQRLHLMVLFVGSFIKKWNNKIHLYIDESTLLLCLLRITLTFGCVSQVYQMVGKLCL